MSMYQVKQAALAIRGNREVNWKLFCDPTELARTAGQQFAERWYDRDYGRVGLTVDGADAPELVALLHGALSAPIPLSEEVAQLQHEIRLREERLVLLAGEPVTIWTCHDGDISVCPTAGATLTVEWAVSDRSYRVWYPSSEAARAALVLLARREDGTITDDGWRADLTVPGCHTSRAWVTRLG